MDYLIGLDLGQASDYTALCVVERSYYVTPDASMNLFGSMQPGWHAAGALTPSQIARARQIRVPSHLGDIPLAVRHLHRWPLGTSYPAIVADVWQLLHAAPLQGRGAEVLVDRTGVGRPVYDMFVAAGMQPIGVTITGGSQMTWDDAGLRLPKRDLIAATQVALQRRLLRFAEGLSEVPTLVKELLDYRVTITEAAHDTYDARSGKHDDLVLALCLPVWYARWAYAAQPMTREALQPLSTGQAI